MDASKGSIAEIKKTLEVMVTPGDVVELRIFDLYSNRKYCGWFNDLNKMAEAAFAHDNDSEGTYYTCNSCIQNMLAQVNNKLLLCKTASSESHIERRRIFGLDIDPERNPKKISSTDYEKQLAYNRAIEVRAWLSSLGFPMPVFGDSGNGNHLDYFTDLPNTPEIKKLYEDVYKAIKAKFPKDAVDVQGFADANRVWKVYGTVARKGENMPNRPHRRSKLLEVPDERRLVTVEMMQKVADTLPKEQTRTPAPAQSSSLNPGKNNNNNTGKAWNPEKLKSWLDEHGAGIERTKQDGDITRFILKTCLMNPEHEGNKEAEVHINGIGVIGYKCHHHSCNEVSWIQVREKHDPEYKKKKEAFLKETARLTGAFDYISKITEKTPIYYDVAGQFWIWNEAGGYKPVDNTEILLTLLKNIADPAIIKSAFKSELLEAARLMGRDARVKEVPCHWLHVQNGVYDIKTGELFEPTPDYLFTDPIPHKITQSEETPTIDKLFSEWVAPEKLPLLNEIAAYSLYNGYPIHRMFIFTGRGRNGKGQYRDFLVLLVGVINRTASSMEHLLNSRFETARLYHKKICTMGEINYTLLDRTALLKMLSGGDPIPGEIKNKHPFDFVNTAKLLINTNSLPQTSDKTDAFYSRCVIVEFCNQFQMGKDIIETIPEEEYDNFLTKSLRVLRELLARGEFTNEGDIGAKEVEYERLSNPLTEFIQRYYEVDINSKVAAWRVMERYFTYCSEKGIRRPSNKTEFNNLLKVNYEIEKKSLRDGEEGEFKNWVWVMGLKDRVAPSKGKEGETPDEKTGKSGKNDDGSNNENLSGEKDLPDLPNLPGSPLRSSIQELSELLGKSGKSGKNDSGRNDEKLPDILPSDELGNNPVTELTHQLRTFGDFYQDQHGVINSSNIVEFCMVFTKMNKPVAPDGSAYTPSAIKGIASKLFKLTPG